MTQRIIGFLKTVSFSGILMLGSIGCSNTAKQDAASSEDIVSEQTVTAGKEWDIERINAYYEKHTPLTESDYDFLLDQLEIFANKRESMSAEAFKVYFDGFSDKEASSYMFLALTPAEANMKGKLTPKQAEKFDSLKICLKNP